MFRKTLPCALLAAFLLSGCGIIQDTFSSQKGGISTPTAQQAAKKQAGPLDSAAARKAAQQQQSTKPAPAPAIPLQQSVTASKIGLLVPLSGKSAPLGQAMVNAAQLAVFDMGIKGFELMPRDTKGTPEGAVQASRDALGSGAQLLIGPLFAADVAAVKPALQGSSVNMLALSTDVSLAGPGAYVMGFAPAPQVERVVSFAARRGLQRFAAVIPAGPYGQLVSKAFEAAVKAEGGTLIAVVPSTNVAALAANKDKIEAIFMPLGGNELRKAVEQLTVSGFESGGVRLLGTGLWDEPNLAQGQSLLVGGWFAASEPDARTRFVQTYKDTYGQEAPRLATLAYDATALAAVLARAGGRYDIAALTSPSGFAGVDGIFRLTPSGQIERGLAVLELGLAESHVVDPAPAAFTGR